MKLVQTILARSLLLLTYLGSHRVVVVVVHAAVSYSQGCENFTLTGGEQEEICATVSMETPSPVQLENGTTSYMGNYAYEYEYEGAYQGWTATVEYENLQTTACTLAINGTLCASCEFCGTEQLEVTANCTSIPSGRELFCEQLEPVLVPWGDIRLSTNRCPGEGDGDQDPAGGQGGGDESKASFGDVLTGGMFVGLFALVGMFL